MTQELISWKPGALCDAQIAQLISRGILKSAGGDLIQPASFDLTLAGDRPYYEVPHGFLPKKGETMHETIQSSGAIVKGWLKTDAVLERDRIYLLPLRERFESALPGFHANVNPKSSSGRLDVFCRVITEGHDRFDEIPLDGPRKLYLLVKPQTFSVRVDEGSRLVQTRIRRLDEHSRQAICAAPGTSGARDVTVGVDLQGLGVNAGWVATERTVRGGSIHVDHKSACEPSDYFDRIPAGPDMVLEPGAFYILATLQPIHVPIGMACEMIPFDASLGEFRTQYAGFFDPGFGDAVEARGVLEVRARDMNFKLAHGQPVCRMAFEPMSQIPTRPYSGNYVGQGLKLSKHFKDAR